MKALRPAVETLILNPASLLAGAVLCAVMHITQTSAAMLFNPWGLSTLYWIAAYAAVRIALLGFVDGLVWALAPLLPPLPSRTGPKAVYQHTIGTKRIVTRARKRARAADIAFSRRLLFLAGSLDITYLVINSTIEFVFTQQMAWLLWHSPLIVRAPAAVSLLNVPAALWLILVVDDMLYAPTHRFMHWPPVYRYVHKHHHRNTFPARGYIDGANEHPVEQMTALTLHWIALHVVAHTVGLHIIAVGLHLGVKALGACFNHTGYDLQFSVLGIDYSVRAHEMHHRKPNTNFAQYVMFWDRCMGTFRPYESGLAPGVGKEAAATADAAERPHAE